MKAGVRMKKIGIAEIEDGIILAKEVVNENNQLLLGAGATIKKEHIDKLLENNILEVYIVETEDKDTVIEYGKIEDDCVDAIKDIIENRLEDCELNQTGKLAEQLIKDALNKPGMKNCMLRIKREKSDIYSHLISTAVLSIIMAIKLEYSDEQLNDIAVGALLHDIGLRDVEIKYTDVEVGSLPAEEKLDYRVHVLKGYESVRKFDWISNGACEIILSHHEKADGSGYPFHKDRKNVSKIVKLVAICDAFDEKANGIGYRKRKVHEIVEYFRTIGTHEYDYSIMSKVIQNIAWFTTGSKVQTNEGEVGIVIRQNKGLPDRPVLKILKDSKGNDVKIDIVKNLTECLTLFIVDTLED